MARGKKVSPENVLVREPLRRPSSRQLLAGIVRHTTRATLCMLGLLLTHAVKGCSFIVANYNLNASHSAEDLAKANWYNQRRGPDATNWLLQSGWSFVHNLLSMTGSVTVQPFVDEGHHVVATFNGEVYNYRELAAELTGSEDAYPSDGYSLLPAYARWGESFLQKLQARSRALPACSSASARLFETSTAHAPEPYAPRVAGRVRSDNRRLCQASRPAEP